jgi:signal transduction histidine kinase/ActR/RegA family two-component response regulator
MNPNRGGLARGLINLAPRIGALTLVFGVALGLSLAVERTSLFFHLDRWINDAVHAATAPESRFEDILIVDVNETAMASLEARLGPWPYDRDVFALVVEHLNSLGAERVVIDMVFSDRRKGDDALADVLAESGNVWLAAQGQAFDPPQDPAYKQQLDALAWKPAELPRSRAWRRFRLPHAGLTGVGTAPTGVGVVSVPPDDDGMLRRLPLMHKSGGHYLPALHLAALFRPLTQPNFRINGDSVRIGDREWPVDADGNVLLRVPSSLDGFAAISFDRAVNSALGEDGPGLEKSLIEGRTIIIGSTTASFGDYARVPIHGRMAGLDILALSVANLAHDLVLTPRSNTIKVLLCILSALLPLLIASRRGMPEWMVLVVYGLGLSSVIIVNLLLVSQYAIQSTLLFPVLISAFTLLGQLTARVKTMHDERRRFYLEKLAADEASELKSQFLSHMTHELRTPLTAIMGYNRLLADNDISDQERNAQVNIIDKNCQHLLSLINNLLDQAKLEAGQMALDVGSVSIEEMIGNVVDTLRPIADGKGLSVDFRIANDVPSGVRVDELKVRQILVNLGGNAIKFTQKGGVVLEVDWSNGNLEVRVVDTGPGMTRQVLDRIFSAFQQADETVARTHGGTGLGLTISRNLARLMGGDIGVESGVGRGSTFSLRIPAQGFEYPSRIKSRTSNAEEAAPKIEGTVLVADDTPDLRQLLSLYLRKLGLEVLLAENGQEAVEIAITERPNLVFMDMQMPVMDGIEAVRVLREQDYTGTVLALTAQSERDRIEAMLDAGCDGYVEKPVRRERLEAIVTGRLAGTVSEAESSLSRLRQEGA